jgi:hypothetical protein
MQRIDAKTDGSDRVAWAESASWHRRLLPRGTTKRRLSLALQGGGSFGAFTWGVLDRLLEQDAIAFDAVSGTSAGAVNAVSSPTALPKAARPRHVRGSSASGSVSATPRRWPRSPAATMRGLAPIGPAPRRPPRSNSRRALSRPIISTRSASTRCAISSPTRLISRGCAPPRRYGY